MKKARIGRRGILFTLIATLLLCAIFAVSGLYFNDIKGATASAGVIAPICASDKNAESVAARATGHAIEWRDAVQSSIDFNESYDVELTDDWVAVDNENREGGYSGFYGEFGWEEDPVGFEEGALLVPENAEIYLYLNGHTVDGGIFSTPAIIVRGTLHIVGPGKITSDGDASANPSTVSVEGGTLFVESGAEISDSPNARGIMIDGGTAELRGSTVSNNDGGQNGAGVYIVNGSTFTMSDSIITGNSCDLYGGGVYVDATSEFIMHSGEISSNVAQGGSSMTCGGGVYNRGKFTLNNGIVKGNTSVSGSSSGNNGGGVYNAKEAEFIMNGGEISANTAAGPSAHGGGVNNAGIFKMTGGEIARNNMNCGYAYGVGLYNSGTFEMTGGKISGNNCGSGGTHYGGGIYNSNSGTVTLTDGEITNNNVSASGASYGGGICSAGTFLMHGGLISGNSLSGSAKYGAGIHVSGGNFEMLGGLITGNTISGSNTHGGGISVSGADTSVTLSGGIIEQNTANIGSGLYQTDGTVNFGDSAIITDNDGTGAYINGGTFNMTGGEISAHSAESGAGVYVNTDGAFNMSGGIICDNYSNSDASSGGGIFSKGTVKISDTAQITGNSAAKGAGVCVDNGTFIIESGKIFNNSGLDRGYGAIYIASSGALTMTGGEISDHTSDYDTTLYVDGTFDFSGGRIHGNEGALSVYIGGGVLNMSGNAEISDNVAAVGGGIFVEGTLNMSGGTVSGNRAVGREDEDLSGDGAGIYISLGAQANISGEAHISDNTASGRGGGIYVQFDETLISGGRIIGNKAQAGGGVYCDDDYGFGIKMQGNPYIFGNTTLDGASASNLKLGLNNSITVTGLLTNARVGVSASPSVITSGFTSSGNAAAGISSFTPDIDGVDAVLNASGEIELQADLVVLWNKAVEDSSETVKTIFTLPCDWIASNGSFGTGAGFKNGALYVPQGKNVLVRSNGYQFNRNLTERTVDGSVFIVEGKLEFDMAEGNIRNGNSQKGGAILIKNGGSVSGNGIIAAGHADYGAGIYVEDGGTLSGKWSIGLSGASVSGGGIYVEGGIVNLSKLKISGCQAGNSGAGLYVAGGNFVIDEITNGNRNQAKNADSRGGFIFIEDGSVTFNGGVIYSNTAACGSAVAMSGGHLILNRTHIYGSSANSGTGNGGAVYMEGGTLDLNSGMIGGTVGNKNIASDGGAFYLTGGAVLNINGGQIDGNNATNGGAVYVTDGATVNLYGGSIEDIIYDGNSAAIGGGVYVDTGATFNMEGGEIRGNNSTEKGGAVFVAGEFNFIGGQISGNVTKASSDAAAVKGSGIYVEGGVVNMSGSAEILSQTGAVCVGANGTFNMNGGSIHDNVSSVNPDHGGAVYIVSGGTFNLTDGEIYGNSPKQGTKGGAFYTEGNLNVSGGRIHGNNSYMGGAIAVGIGGMTVITGGEIYSNSGRDGAGGAIRMDGGAVEFTSGSIHGNYARAAGGAVFMTAGTFTMGGSASMTDNSTELTTTGGGGAIRLQNSGSVIISGGTISNNTTGFQGGAIYVTDGSLYITGGVIADNTAKYIGGVSFSSQGVFEMTGGRISGNSSTSNESKANGLSASSSDGLISGGVISGNLGGVSLAGTFRITGGTITGNGDESGYYNRGLSVGGTVTMSGSASIVNNIGSLNYSGQGAVSVGNGTFIMNGGIISGNSGSGISAQPGSVVQINDGIISGNRAYSGGGIYQHNNSSVIISGGRITGNTADSGAGVYVQRGSNLSETATFASFKMTGGEISGNTAELGAGVYFESNAKDADTVITMEGNPVISNNLTPDGVKSNLFITGKGTQVIQVSGKFTQGAEIGVTTFGKFTYGLHHDNPEALDYFVADQLGSDVEIRDYELYLKVDFATAWNETVQESLDTKSKVKFTLLEDWYADNDADFETSFGTGAGFKDGALYVPSGADIVLDVQSFVINRNKPTRTEDGSVVRVSGALEITSGSGILANRGGIVGGNAVKGGGVFVEDGGNFVLANAEIGMENYPNSATLGGGVYVGVNAEFIITGGSVGYNTAEKGGGVYIDGGSFTMECHKNGYVQHNSATDGAGLYLNDGTVGEGINGFISQNTATGNGGGVYIADGVYNMRSMLQNNKAANGAGIYVTGGSARQKYIIDTNTATGNGGGVYVAGGEFTAECRISENKANSAAGIYVADGAKLISVDGADINTNGMVRTSGASFRPEVSIASGVWVAGGEFVMEGGNIYNSSARLHGGAVYVTDGGVFTMKGGEITRCGISESASANGVKFYGGVVEISEGKFIFENGLISGAGRSFTNGAGVFIGENASFTMNGGEITGFKNGASTDGDETISGAGVFLKGTFVMNGGEISSNVSSYNSGGGVYVGGGASFTLNDGIIKNNSSVNGGGVYVGTNATLTMTGGEISLNRVPSSTGSGGGISANTGSTVIISGGKINGNTAGRSAGGIMLNGTLTVTDVEMDGNSASWYGGAIYVYRGSTAEISGGTYTNNSVAEYSGGAIYVYGNLTLTGGVITGNSAAVSGGGLSYETTLNISGAPRIYGNFLNGDVNNVQAHQNADIKLNITGKLTDGKGTAYIGFTAPEGRVFTNGFGANNPNALPSTYFFSDSTSYSVKSNGTGGSLEAVIGAKVQQIALTWQYSSNGSDWTVAESPNFAVEWTGGRYTVRAVNSLTGVTVAFKSATDADGNSVTAVSDIGVYSFIVENVLNGEEGVYLNPVLTFEIIKAEVQWQYATDGSNWRELDFGKIEYTGLSYSFRAFYNGSEVLAFADTAKDAGAYTYKINDALYSNSTLEFIIEKRNVKVEWNFDGAKSDRQSYSWTYDGYAHGPVAYLTGVSSEQAGLIDLDFIYTCVDRSGNSATYSAAQSKAGDYSVTVALLNAADAKNIILTNNTASYKINAIALSLEWTDADGAAGSEFNFGFDGKAHPVNAVIHGALAGDGVNVIISYVKDGREVVQPSGVGTYTAEAKLPLSFTNYYLDKVYTCQIVISSAEAKVEWTGNADKNGAFVWTYNGQAKAPSVKVVNSVDGSEITSYTAEYAAVSADGTVGAYSSVKPVNAGRYSVKISYADGNFTLLDAVKEYEIEKLGVTLTWTGGEKQNGVIRWQYDGAAHDITPQVKGLEIWTASGIIGTLEVERTDGLVGGITSVGSATATAALKNTPFNANFYITNSPSQDYEVYKRVITSAEWKDSFGNIYSMGETAEYDYGTITGAKGPDYAVTVPDYTAANGKLSLAVTYSASFGGEWAVDETNGYKAVAELSAGDFANYEFDDGTDKISFTFYIMEISENKQNINVTWVVFINASDYVTLADYLAAGGFVYSGSVQSPTPIYIKDVNTGAYEKLALSLNSIGADAKKYVARLLPSDKYNIPASQFTCEYEIKPLSVEIKWQDGENDTGTTFNYTYDNTVKKPYAYAQAADGTVFTDAVTVEGKINAGSHIATAKVNSNFTVSSGRTQRYVIAKLGLDTSLITWSFDGASGNDTDGWYWVYDGAAHAPTAKIVLSSLGITIELTVTGRTSVAGTHYAYAVLDGSNSVHANFTLTGTASVQFKIVQISAGTVIWEDADGNLSVNGANKLTLVYNGAAQAPKAYFTDSNGKQVALNVNGKMTDVGTYTAYVTDEFDFGLNADGSKVVPKCVYEIKPMKLNVVWSDTSLTFNGKAQSPTAEVSDAVLADGTTVKLVNGTDYTLSSFKTAGRYTAKITFKNTNYTFDDGCGEVDFEIEKIKLGATDAEWTANGALTDAVSNGWYWQYDAQNHSPVLSLLSAYELDGDPVTIVFAYRGEASTVGIHTATAYIHSASWRGEDVSASFAVDSAIEEKDYEITAFEISVRWDFDGAGGNDTDGWFWTYDGSAHAPKAFYTDWTGAEKQLTVYGAETNARLNPYKASVNAPKNCKFASSAVTEKEYCIKQASIEVIWDFSAAGASGNDTDGWYWTYDGLAHAPKAFIKVTASDGTVTKGAELKVTGEEADAGTHTAMAAQDDGNYVITAGGTQIFIINEREVYVLWYGEKGNTTDSFVWAYTGGVIAPTAKLADANGALILDASGNEISVQVTGGMTDASSGVYTAQAVDSFANYKFASATATHTFRIIPKDLGDGFKWNANGAQVSADGLTFTFSYNGGALAPIPTATTAGISFIYDCLKVDASGAETSIALENIRDAGSYKMTVKCNSGNYEVPDSAKTVTIIITPCETEVIWNTGKLTFNGSNQLPAAYYLDANGTKVSLTDSITVTDGDGNPVTEYKNAGVYKASAKLTAGGNYVLKAETADYIFEIAKKELPVTWKWDGFTDKAVTYDGGKHAPIGVPTFSGASGVPDIQPYFVITDGDGNTLADNTKVINAGVYKITYKLRGGDAGNYELKDGEQTFTVKKAALTVTAENASVTYGATAPKYNATFTGFIAADAAIETQLKSDGMLGQWLICGYVNTTVPGSYAITVDKQWLADYLKNYEVSSTDGVLQVTPAAGVLIWQGGTPNGIGFVYNGQSCLPKAYYYTDPAETNPHSLTVTVYKTRQDAENGTNPVTAVSAGVYFAKASGGDGTHTFANSIEEFAVAKLEITVNIKDLSFTYGEVFDTNISSLLAENAGWTFGGNNRPVSGDGLGIVIALTPSSGDWADGFLNAGKYVTSGSWNVGGNKDLENNYVVTFVGSDGADGRLEVKKAGITVDIEENADGYNYLEDFISRGGIYHVKDLKDFLTFAGSQSANVNIKYSATPYKFEEGVDDGVWGAVNEVPFISAAGLWVVNYNVGIANHETKTGKLLISLVSDEFRIVIVYDGTFQLTYGEEIPANLAEVLFEKKVVKVDEDASAYTTEQFLAHATATLYDAEGNPVTGRLPAGRYEIRFTLDNTVYRIDGKDAEKSFEVTKRAIDISWGELEFKFDGSAHMPVISVADWTKPDGAPLTLQAGENTLTIDGETVKVFVMIEGDLTKEGGHSVLITVESDNYTVNLEDSTRAVSVIGESLGETVQGNLPDWALGVITASAAILIAIIIALAVIAKKRKARGDDDGFYDDADETA